MSESPNEIGTLATLVDVLGRELVKNGHVEISNLIKALEAAKTPVRSSGSGELKAAKERVDGLIRQVKGWEK